jgi:hypothetical protein
VRWSAWRPPARRRQRSTARARRFVGAAVAALAGERQSSSAGLGTLCHGIRGLAILGLPSEAARLARRLGEHRTRWGGFSARPGGPPDLVSTYQAALSLQRLGRPVPAGLDRFLGAIEVPGGGHSWAPVFRRAGGPLATAMARLLDAHARSGGERPLPSLNL